MKLTQKSTQKTVQKFKLLKMMALSTVIVTISILLGSFQSEAVLHNYIETLVTPKDVSFYVNDIKGNYAFISTSDNIETGEDEVTFTLNNISSVKISPYSQVQFLRLGNKPSIKIIKGDIEIQTISSATVFSHNNKAIVRQGGLKISHKENYSEFGNYYGNTTLAIQNKNKEAIISYALPILKKVNIFTESNKSNWNTIRYSKLNKELRLTEFKEKVSRKVFSPNSSSLYSQIGSSSFLQEKMTLTPKKINSIEQQKLYEKIDELKKAIKDKSPTRISTIIRDLQTWKNHPELQNLQNLIASVNDPLTRYYLEINLLKLFGETQNSIDLETKYFYSLWLDEELISEQKLLEEIDRKIENNKEKLYVQEEYYNLITSLIEAYPSLASYGIIRSKNSIERNLFEIVNTPTEKADIILSSYTKNLHIISKLIENNNGKSARLIYDTMLINTKDYSNEKIISFRKKNKEQEEEIQDLLNFYQERLHSAAFNKNIFSQYKENKKQEKEAIRTFKSNIPNIRTRPIKHNFSSVIQDLEKYSIYASSQNINLLFSGAKDLYIQEAELIPRGEYSFNFVYNPETKIVSQVEWNTDITMPSMSAHIPLKEFQKSYNTLLNIELQTAEKEDEVIIQDWSYEAEEMKETYNYEENIKKQLSKEELEKYQISAKQNYMGVLSDSIISIKNATFSFIDEEGRERDIYFDMEIDTEGWNVTEASFIEFPEAEILTDQLHNIHSQLSQAYQEELEKKEIQEEAKRVFRGYNPDIKIQDFVVSNKDKKIASFTNLALFLDEEIWRISGSYSTLTEIINTAELKSDSETFSLKNLEVKSLKDYMKNLSSESDKDINDLILESLLDEDFFDEINAEITELQL